jgi:hypothetical protein
LIITHGCGNNRSSIQDGGRDRRITYTGSRQIAAPTHRLHPHRNGSSPYPTHL